MVGTTGFEPAASASRTQRSTKLSHVPATCISIHHFLQKENPLDSVLYVTVHLAHRKEAAMFQIDQKSRKSIYRQVVDNITGLIMRGVLAPGSRLPSVRELSRQLLINPNTVAKAYRELEKYGYIYTAAGLGTFVSEVDTERIDMEKYSAIKDRLSFYISELYYMGLDDDKVMETVKEIIDKRGAADD